MNKPAKPRVHWVSPLPPAETDIGHYTARILPELAEATELTLWTDALQWDRSLEKHCTVRRLDPDAVLPRDFPRDGCGQSGAVFVHIGNSWVYHSGFLRLVQRIPSIIVLHDLAIQELCYEAILNDRFSADIYRDGMTRWHGEKGASLSKALLAGEVSALDVAMHVPGFELALPRAISVLAHTPAAYEATGAREMLPAYLLDLPFRPSAQRPSAERAETGPLRFAQFGYIGPNRRLEAVLEALSEVRDEVDFIFDIMGKVWNPGYIQGRIEELDLTGRVIIHGFVDEPALDACLAQAHLVFNLRYPTMGEASGSQLRIWNASGAAVVSDLGWYGSLPDDTVFKVPHADERGSLVALLRLFAADRSIGAEIGAAGRKRLEARHTPARYAQGVAYVAAQAAEDARSALLARSASSLLGNCANPHPLLLTRLGRQIERVSGPFSPPGNGTEKTAKNIGQAAPTSKPESSHEL